MVTFFSTAADFRQWLSENHDKVPFIIVGFYTVKSGKCSMAWTDAVDQALCFGWIDGVKHRLDNESYQIRFTPRKKTSIWSRVNIKKVEKLTAQGLMHEAGIRIYNHRKESRSAIYAFEQDNISFSETLEQQFRANEQAWSYFQSLAPSYRKYASHWVMSAKREDTQMKRMEELINDSQCGTNKWKDNKYNKK